MGRITYGLGFIGIIIATNFIKYKQQDIIDQIFALDSINPADKFRPNITFEGFVFLEQLLVCVVAYGVVYITQTYRGKEEAYREVDTVANVEMDVLYQRVETTQQQSPSIDIRNNNNDQQAPKSPRQVLSTPPLAKRIPLQYSIILGLIYFISTKSFASVQTKFNITMAVGFKALNIVIIFIIHSCINRGQITIPFINIRLSYGKRTMTGFYYLLMMIFVSGSSMAYSAVDDLFRIAMVDSNRSLALLFDRQAIALYVLVLILEHFMISILLTIKDYYRNVSPSQVIVTMLQFSVLCFGINLIYTSTFSSTLSLFYKYPGSSSILLQLCIMGFCQHYIFSYTLINYPMIILLTLISSRPSLKYIRKHLIDEPSTWGIFYGTMAFAVVMFVVELIKLDGKINDRNNGKVVVVNRMIERNEVRSDQ